MNQQRPDLSSGERLNHFSPDYCLEANETFYSNLTFLPNSQFAETGVKVSSYFAEKGSYFAN